MSLCSVEPGLTSLTICKQTHRALIHAFIPVTRRVDAQATLALSPLPRK